MRIGEMIDYALDNRLRWKTGKGQISLEDLYQLTREELDEIYISLKKEDEHGLIHKETMNIPLEIVSHVFEYREIKAKERQEQLKKREYKETLLSLLHDKQKEGLKDLSMEELQELLDEL